MANRMSLFYAEATPMLKTLSNATTHFVSEVSNGREKGKTQTFLILQNYILNTDSFLTLLEQNTANRKYNRLFKYYG